MLSAAVEALQRALAREWPRRALPGIAAATFLAANSHGLSEARKLKKERRGPRKARRGKGNKKDKKKKKNDRCKNRYSEKEILAFIRKAAQKYGQSKKAMERVARCESVLDPCAVNRSGPYYGLYQFLKSTWKTTPYKNRSIWDPKAQALATAWMWKKGRKNEWACK
jgi:hypothetical protein